MKKMTREKYKRNNFHTIPPAPSFQCWLKGSDDVAKKMTNRVICRCRPQPNIDMRGLGGLGMQFFLYLITGHSFRKHRSQTTLHLCIHISKSGRSLTIISSCFAFLSNPICSIKLLTHPMSVCSLQTTHGLGRPPMLHRSSTPCLSKRANGR